MIKCFKFLTRAHVFSHETCDFHPLEPFKLRIPPKVRTISPRKWSTSILASPAIFWQSPGAVFAGEGILVGLKAYRWLAASSGIGCACMLLALNGWLSGGSYPRGWDCLRKNPWLADTGESSCNWPIVTRDSVLTSQRSPLQLRVTCLYLFGNDALTGPDGLQASSNGIANQLLARYLFVKPMLPLKSNLVIYPLVHKKTLDFLHWSNKLRTFTRKMEISLISLVSPGHCEHCHAAACGRAVVGVVPLQPLPPCGFVESSLPLRALGPARSDGHGAVKPYWAHSNGNF